MSTNLRPTVDLLGDIAADCGKYCSGFDLDCYCIHKSNCRDQILFKWVASPSVNAIDYRLAASRYQDMADERTQVMSA